MKSLRTAVIGVGTFGENHARAYAEYGRSELVWVCDLNEERGRKVASRYGARYTPDYEEVAQDPSVQAVSVATPDFAHTEPVLRMIEAGKHVLVEKPLATSVEEARRVILDKLAERKPPVGGVGVQVIEDERDKFSRAAQDALLLRVGARVEQPAPGAEDLRGLTLFELAKECLRRANIPLVGDRMAIVQRAFTHTSSDFPIILQNVVNKQLVDAYTELPTTYQLWTRKATADNFKELKRVWLGNAPKLTQIPEGGEYKEITLGEAGESYAIGTYGAMFSITRQAIINDDLDAFQRIPRLFGSAAKRTVNETVYAILKNNPTMADGKTLFHADHGNEGTAGAIGEDTFNEAIQKMSEQKDLSGEAILGIMPRFLIVPPALKTTALKWLKSTALPQSGMSSGVFNPFQNVAEPVVEPALSAAAGGSDTAWYMAADPRMVDTIEVAFLGGNEEPRVESQKGFEVDGMRFKVSLDFGAKAIDWRGLFRNVGA